MPLKRVLEPEVMDSSEEAHDYNNMDHSQVNTLFVDDLRRFAVSQGRVIQQVLDLGTGTALIPIELIRHESDCQVTAIDMANYMLQLARENVQQAGFSDRISLQRVDAKAMPFDDASFDCSMSNSIIHHIPDPAQCLRELVRVTSPGGLVFVRDLLRPDSDDEVKQLVETYAGEENDHARQMFDDSLRAALSLDEIRDLVADMGFAGASVAASSDRHWTWAAVKPRNLS